MRKTFEESNRPDIIFASANVFGREDKEKNFKPYEQELIIDPDSMFQEIEQVAYLGEKQKRKALRIEKHVLNWQSFDSILDRSPRLLILMCHGSMQLKSGVAQFSFEDAERPYLADLFDEDRLVKALQGRQQREQQNKIGAIVLSTCHSEQLGKIMLQHIQPPPAIIAINAREAVAQWATMQFNPKFIESLIDGKTVLNAFQAAQRKLNMAKAADNKICCCEHSHVEDCLFLKRIKKEGKEAVHKKYCYPSCNCYSMIKEQFSGREQKW